MRPDGTDRSYGRSTTGVPRRRAKFGSDVHAAISGERGRSVDLRVKRRQALAELADQLSEAGRAHHICQGASETTAGLPPPDQRGRCRALLWTVIRSTFFLMENCRR